MNRPTSFLDAAQQEKLREREALASGLMFSRDRLIEMIPVTIILYFTCAHKDYLRECIKINHVLLGGIMQSRSLFLVGTVFRVAMVQDSVHFFLSPEFYLDMDFLNLRVLFAFE